MLVGRGEETARIDSLLAGVRQGRSGALVVRGDIGIGKTSLLAYARDAATGMQVLATTGVESEAELAYSGLHALFHRVPERIDALPETQAAALRLAFGHGPGEPADPYLIGLGILNLLSDLAEANPLLCLVDDLPWIDDASRVALLFAARRLDAEGAGMLFATRCDGPAAPGISELRLRALPPESAALVPEVRSLPDPVRRKLIADAHGNPLALVELAAAVTADSARASADLAPGGPMAAAGRVQASFAARISALPEATRTVLRVAAAEDTGALDVVLAAARRLGAQLADLAPAELAGLIRVEGAAARFRHPLTRSAAYHDGTLAERLAAHRALAEVLTDPRDADRRAWHLGSAAAGLDEPAAEALAGAAERALRVGGRAAAAAAFELAGRLTGDTELRADRLARSATALAESGRWEQATELADEATPLTDDPVTLTRLAAIRVDTVTDRGELGDVMERALDVAEAVGERDPASAALIFFKVAASLWNAWRARELPGVAARLRALRLPSTPDTAPYIQGTEGFARLAADEYADGIAAMRAGLAGLRLAAGDAPLIQRAVQCGWGFLVGSVDGVYADALAVTREARERGAVGALGFALGHLGRAQVLLGRLRAALGSVAEGMSIGIAAADTNTRGYLLYVRAQVAAIAGDEESCARDMAELPEHTLWHLSLRTHAVGLLDLGMGRYDSALAHLEPLTAERHRHLITTRYALPDLVEAAVRLGQPERARPAAERFAAWAAATGEDWANAVALRCRALLAPDDERAELYERALSLEGLPFQAARTRLLYGEHLRRARRRSDARTPLAAALEAFERMGARPWADRARVELRAAGQNVAPARTGVRLADRLTPQELQVARMAAAGLSNRDIGAQLFLSPRTVGYHLYKLFPKLGVTSRTALASLDLDD